VSRTGTFDYSLTARCEPAQAVRLLSDFSLHDQLHPLIVKVERVPPEPGVLSSFAITDRLRWGPVTFPITYHADVLVAGPDEVVTVARQQPRTTLRNHTRLHPQPDGTLRIDVRITLTAPTPLFGYAFRQARAAHAELAQRLRTTLEAQPA
jgi:hypothetical protein